MAEFIVMFYQSWVVRKELPLREYILNSFGFLVKAIIMFAIIVLLGKQITSNNLLRVIIQVVIGMIIYVLLNFKYIYNILGINKFLNKRKGINS